MKNSSNFFILSLILFYLSQTAFPQTIYYVKTTGNDSSSGLSWDSAFATIQKALDAAQAGDQIWVASGTYNPTSTYGEGDDPGLRHFRLKDSVEMYGGFAGTETSIAQRTNYGVGSSNETILSGNLGGGSNCYHVFYHPDNTYSLSNSTILDGFTIQNGLAAAFSPHDHGAGMFNGNLSNPVIRNCTFKNNSAQYGGGAIYIGGNSSTYVNCLFYENDAMGTPWSTGGAIYCNNSSPTFINCTIVNNHSINGGGFYVLSNSILTLNNCIVWGNTAGTGNQIYNGGTVYLNYSCYSNSSNDIYGNSVNTTSCITDDPQFVNSSTYDFRISGISPCADAGNNSYCNTTYDIRGYNYPRKLNKNTGETGTIDIGAYEYKLNDDPLPVELSSFVAINKSRCIELKWITETEVNNYGFEIERRYNKNLEWMKVGFVQSSGNSNSPKEYTFTDYVLDEGYYSYRLKQIDLDGSYKYSQSIEINFKVPEKFVLFQNYPNPFNPLTTIDFIIPEDGKTTLKIYDISGKEIKTLVNSDLNKGKIYRIKFDGSELSSGTYFYILESKNHKAVKKFIILK